MTLLDRLAQELKAAMIAKDAERLSTLRLLKSAVGYAQIERGTETLEWGLVCGLIVVGAITMIVMIGPKVADLWTDVNNEIPAGD